MSLGRHIEVHIEELVLHGFQRGDHRAIADAIEREVTRALSVQPSALSQDRRIARVDGSDVRWGDSSGAHRVGTEVARVIGGTMTGGRA